MSCAPIFGWLGVRVGLFWVPGEGVLGLRFVLRLLCLGLWLLGNVLGSGMVWSFGVCGVLQCCFCDACVSSGCDVGFCLLGLWVAVCWFSVVLWGWCSGAVGLWNWSL